MAAADGPRVSLARLLGAEPSALRDRLGDPRSDLEMDGQRWMVFELDGVGSLRCRCVPVVGTWSLSFAPPLPPSLRDAARSVDLWPQLGPDALPPEEGETLVRRELAVPSGAGDAGEGVAGVASATALLRPDGVVRLAAFDEPPEW